MAKRLNSGLTIGLHQVQSVASSKDLFCSMSLTELYQTILLLITNEIYLLLA